MRFQRVTLANCAAASGTVVVIDVLRAFSTAAYAFAAGVKEIILTGEVDEALGLHQRFPGSYVMGEVGGLPAKGFDFGNSPAQFAGWDLRGRRLIQRTSAGTQGVVLSAQAEILLASSFVCARATAEYLGWLNPPQVTFVISGAGPLQQADGKPVGEGDEDAACADYLEALLRGLSPDTAPFIRRVRESPDGQVHVDPAQPFYVATDLDDCTQIDRFDFAMQVRRQDGLLVMHKVTELYRR